MFVVQRKIRFQHCDPAGIVFYPRYFELVNSVVEDWFEKLGAPFSDMHGPDAMGVPTAQLTARFSAPSRLGDVIDFKLTADRIGASSLDITLIAECGGEARMTVEVTLVHISLATGKPVRWPEGLCRAIETYLKGPCENGK